MADKAVSELIEAERITATDLFVLEQNGTAKKLTGQVLLNWLTAAADGHGGIQTIQKVGTNVLADTYRIILADTTTFDFVVTNGRGISSITKTATSGLVDTYTIQYNDGTSAAFTVTNGEKGDKGDNTYTWIKYASQEPTATSHSFGDVPDNWIGVYFGSADTAPTDWTQYQWFKIKGEKGETGEPATLTSSVVEYQASDSGSIIPSGVWTSSVPVVAQGRYLWTRTTQNFNTGSPVVAYSVSRMGLDGSGSVSSVAGVSPDPDGNVPLAAESVGALSSAGGEMTGPLNMNGQKLSGLNAPTANDEAATKFYVDNAKPDLTGYATETYVDDALENFVSGMSIELLWENASPSSTFAAQTVTVDWSGFDLLLIGGTVSNGTHEYYPPLTIRAKAGEMGYILAVFYSGDLNVRARKVTIAQNGLTFETGTLNGGDGANYCVPQYVYGIKGVK